MELGIIIALLLTGIGAGMLQTAFLFLKKENKELREKNNKLQTELIAAEYSISFFKERIKELTDGQ